MVAYKLSKNGWVMPFFVIFRLAREKLLVTVALDHPVAEDLSFNISQVEWIGFDKACLDSPFPFYIVCVCSC